MSHTSVSIYYGFSNNKNDFQLQINNYNISMDSKIDNAITSYLTGITTAKEMFYYYHLKNNLNYWHENKKVRISKDSQEYLWTQLKKH